MNSTPSDTSVPVPIPRGFSVETLLYILAPWGVCRFCCCTRGQRVEPMVITLISWSDLYGPPLNIQLAQLFCWLTSTRLFFPIPHPSSFCHLLSSSIPIPGLWVPSLLWPHLCSFPKHPTESLPLDCDPRTSGRMRASSTLTGVGLVGSGWWWGQSVVIS